MGNRNPPPSYLRGQLMSPRLCRHGRSLIPVLCPDRNGVVVMGPWEAGELGGGRWERVDASMLGA